MSDTRRETPVTSLFGLRPSFRPFQVFLQGRHYEQRVDASALRADEGRGIAAISVGEPRAGVDPTISEWGNPATFGW